ncbi:hypothetical protein D3C79_895610 [compost metagenome]
MTDSRFLKGGCSRIDLMLSLEAWLVRGWSSRRGLSGERAGSVAHALWVAGISIITAINRTAPALTRRWRIRRNTSSISQASSMVRRFRYRLKPQAT